MKQSFVARATGLVTAIAALAAATQSAVADTISAPLAEAGGFRATLTQEGANVVANGSGALNLSSLIHSSLDGFSTNLLYPHGGDINIGPAFAEESSYLFPTDTFSGPTNFGSGNGAGFSVASGDTVVFGEAIGVLGVPMGYTAGSELSDSATYDNATFAGLGVTPGTYVWTWGTGANQMFTLDVQLISPVPLPPSLPLLGSGLLGLVFLRRRNAA